MKKVLFLMVMLTAFAVAETDPELNTQVSDTQSSVETATEVSDQGQDMVVPENGVTGDATSADNVSQNGNYPSESNPTEEQQPATCLGGGGIMSFLPMIAIIAAIVLVIFFLPAIKAFSAAKGAKKFKALVFVTTFFEWLGWSLCITIIGIPIGLALVLAGQSGRVLVLL